jgi:L-glutamine-phosphate cytidylyltransferase
MGKLTAIIMAAGKGTRLGELTKNTPKPLLEVAGKPLIEYGINFLKLVGTDRIIVVGGYLFDELKREVERIDPNVEIVFNENYEKGNIFSLEAGLKMVDESFLLYHADHVFHSDIAEKIKKQLDGNIVAFTDNDRKLGDDDMKIEIDSSMNFLKKISKKLDNTNLGYVGITYCPKILVGEFKKAMEAVKLEKKETAVSEDISQYIADNTDLNIFIGDVSGSKWFEIDYPEELFNVKEYANKNNIFYMTNDKERCALCFSNDSKTVCLEAGLKKGGSKTITNVICEKCGLIYNNQMPTDDFLNDYYKVEFVKDQLGNNEIDVIKNHLSENQENKNKNMNKMLKFIEPFMNKQMKVLDIGCGHGALISKIKEQFNCNVDGIEPDIKMTQAAKQLFGLDVTNCTFQQYMKGENKKVDFVILKMVLEHIKNPNIFLREIKNGSSPK